MEQFPAQHRPAPQFEQQQIGVAPAQVHQEPPDLEAMAVTLDQMKVEAAIDSERTRPGLNGLFALLVVGGAAFIGQYIARYGAQSMQKLTDAKALVDPQMIAQAVAGGLVVAALVGLVSWLATRRTQAAVHAYEQRLISLGGTPLPERGQRLDNRQRG
jgi:hypothetical protein